METERITVRLPVKQIQALDIFVRLGEFATRSEAIRRAVNLLIEQMYEKVEKWEKMEQLRKSHGKTEEYMKK